MNVLMLQLNDYKIDKLNQELIDAREAADACNVNDRLIKIQANTSTP